MATAEQIVNGEIAATACRRWGCHAADVFTHRWRRLSERRGRVEATIAVCYGLSLTWQPGGKPVVVALRRTKAELLAFARSAPWPGHKAATQVSTRPVGARPARS